MRIPDVAWVPFFQSPSNILAWTLDLPTVCCSPGRLPSPAFSPRRELVRKTTPPVKAKGSTASCVLRGAFCNHPRLSLFSPCQSLAQEVAATILKTTDSKRLRFRHAGFLQPPPS